MNDTVPTVLVKSPNGPVRINLADFDKSKHEMITEETAPLQPLAPAAKQALFGSSKQPATFNTTNGTVQLGTVIAEAHKRSGLEVEAWNNLPQDEREALIAAVVEEIAPAQPSGFTIAKRRNAKGEPVVAILDASGKQFGNDFATEEEAATALQALTGEKA